MNSSNFSLSSDLSSILEKRNTYTQRNLLLEKNPDKLFGVYKVIASTENDIRFELVNDILCCFPDEIPGLHGLDSDENPDIQIVSLPALRKGRIELLHGKTIQTTDKDTPVDGVVKPKYTLVSVGVIELFQAKNSSRPHILTTTRPGNITDSALQTTSAGRAIGSNFLEECERENIEEAPFLGTIDGKFVLCTCNTQKKSILIDSIKDFLVRHYKKDDVISAHRFEKRFPGISYAALPEILDDIVTNNRIFEYVSKPVDEHAYFMNSIKIVSIGGRTGKFYLFHDEANNTYELRKIQQFVSFPEGYAPISIRPGRLYLESDNQTTRIPRIENASKRVVPTIAKVSENARNALEKDSYLFSTQTQLFSEGEQFTGTVYNRITSQFQRISERLQAGESFTTIFDIDGTLIEAGLETGLKKEQTLKEFAKNNQGAILQFQKYLGNIQKLGGKVVICTGRGRVFAQRIEKEIFGNVAVDEIICEGGGMIVTSAGVQILPEVEENFLSLQAVAQELKTFIAGIGGMFEEGKEICLSFNPPSNLTIHEFRKQIEDFASRIGIDPNKVYITNSQTAVDINPAGVDKMIALGRTSKNRVNVYFGDARNDESAMRHIADISVAPKNSDKYIVEEIVKRGKLGILPQGNELLGVSQALKTLVGFLETVERK